MLVFLLLFVKKKEILIVNLLKHENCQETCDKKISHQGLINAYLFDKRKNKLCTFIFQSSRRNFGWKPLYNSTCCFFVKLRKLKKSITTHPITALGYESTSQNKKNNNLKDKTK